MRYALCLFAGAVMLAGFGLASSGQEKDKDANKGKDAPAERSTYHDAVYGFSLEAPRFPAAGANQAALPAIFSSPSEGGFSSNVNVSVQMISTTREKYRILSLGQMKQLGLKVNKDTDVTISGRDAMELDYEGQVQGRDLHFLSISVIQPDRVVVVTCTAKADSFKMIEPEFRACLASLKLK